MTTIVTRAGKGSSLSWSEGDANFTNLNNDKLETSTAAATYTTKVDPATSGTLTHSGDIVLSGTGRRITGDFSNATVAARVIFQTSTPNAVTSLRAIPNGTATASNIAVTNSSDTLNCAVLSLAITSTFTTINSAINGTGTYLPLTFQVGGAERLRITDAGNVLVTSSGGLGYGTGAGGTVTQATSKSTAVTLNKPCGKITTHNAALAAGASIDFTLNNSLIELADIVMVNVSGNANHFARCNSVAAGTASLRVSNFSAGSLSDAVVINFVIIKGATV